MKTIKQLLTTIAVLLCSVMTHAYNFEVDGIYYYITSSENLTVEVTYTSYHLNNDYKGKIVIPATVTYNEQQYNVTSIGDDAFYNCTSLTSITIPNSVTSIGESAFSSCSSLCSFIIPKGVNSIESSTFYECSSLNSITLHENIDSIKGKYTFYNCTNLHKIINYSNLSLSIGSSEYGYIAFYAKSIINTNEVINIGNFQFLTSDSIHYLVNYIGQDSVIILPNNYNGENYSIGKCAFRDCSTISSITIPNKVTAIENHAFDNCISLKNVIFEDGENSLTLGYNHYDDDNISNDAGQGLFFDCPLESIYIGRNLIYPRSENNVDYNGDDFRYGYSPFCDKDKLTSVSFGKCDSIISIKNSMFRGCSKITNITLPNSIINIGFRAFYGCSELKNITIPDSVTNIDHYAFYGCSSFTNITIPNSVTNIGDYAFNGCLNLRLVVIGTGVLSIGYKQTYPIKVIWLPNTPPIGRSNFSGSINYVSNDQYYFSVGPTSYPRYVYPHLSSMFEVNGIRYVPVSPAERTCDIIDCTIDSTTTQITIDSNVVYNGIEMAVNKITPYAFYDNDYILGTIHIKNKGNIGASSFYNCNNIENVIISNLGDIEVNAFANCTNLRTAIISNQGNLESKAFMGCSNLERVDISNKGYIGTNAFNDCTNLKTATISNQGNIESEAFMGCPNLEQVDISNKGYIGTKAFSDCINLKNANINNIYPQYTEGVYTFFDGWTATKNQKTKTYSFTAEEGATLAFQCYIDTYDEDRYQDTYSSMTVRLNGQEIADYNAYTSSQSEYTYNKPIAPGEYTLEFRGSFSQYGNGPSVFFVSIYYNSMEAGAIRGEAFMGCAALKTVTLGDSIGALADKVFYKCSNLQEIIIPDSIKSIGKSCFGDCSALKNVILGSGLSKIKEYTFQNCTYLEKVKIGNNIDTIQKNAFENCSYLSNINISNTIKSIDDNVFKGCTSLKNVIIENRTTPLTLGSNEKSPLFIDCPLDSVYIGGKITYTYSPFSNTPLRTIIISDQKEQILNKEFYGCANLQNVITGDNVKSIGDYAFSGCCNLKNFIVGSNIREIGVGAFDDCTAMSQLTSNAIVPPTCDANALDDINKWSCVLKIPQNTLAAYKAAEQWKDFFFIEDVIKVKKFLLTYIVDEEIIYSDSVFAGSIITVLDKPTKEGHTFSGWKIEDGGYVPKTMPANDLTIIGTFTANRYWTTYYVDDKFYLDTKRTYGEDISLVEEPEKEGYTFSGWKIEGFDEIPETMPAQNLKIMGYFTINTYAVNYVIDGEIYAADSVVYGGEIVLREEPQKEGYTFSGWSEVLETMPANDVTITGSFAINTYAITYMIDDEVFAIDSLNFGTEIVLRDEPTKEGYTFSGWSETPDSMPANDITITGSFSINTYAITYMIDDEVFAIDSLTYGSKIVLRDEPEKEGYVFSGWSEAPETMPANDITITGSFDATAIQNVTIDATNIEIKDNSIILQNINNSTITIYTINGVLVKSIDNYAGEEIALDKGLYIVCIGNESIKIKI